MRRRLSLITKLACCIGLLAAASSSYADGRLWIVTGEAYKDDYYFSLGTVLPLLPGSRLGNGWVQRYWLDTFTYDYESNGRRIDANVWGGEAMLGYQASRPGLSGAAYLGVRYSNASLSPDDPSNDIRGDNFWLKGQLEGEAALDRKWRVNGIVSYLFGLDGYWSRVRLLRSLSGTHFIGPEAIAQGDPKYNAYKLGVAVGGFQPVDKVFVTFKGGYRWQSGANSPYAGFEVVGEF